MCCGNGVSQALLKCKDYLAFFAFYQIISAAQVLRLLGFSSP